MAQAAAELIGDGEAVIVDDGTTCAALAARLAGRPIQALALSLRAAGELAARPGADVVVPGGPVRPVALCFRGAQAVEAVRDFRADVAVLGACSAAPGLGLTATEAEDARLKRACLETAARRILLVSPEKLERSSVHRFGRIEDVSVLVTGATARPRHLEAFRAAGAQVVTVARSSRSRTPRADADPRGRGMRRRFRMPVPGCSGRRRSPVPAHRLSCRRFGADSPSPGPR
ncbi:MAG: DeoR/GlpR family DNA-binding transcription regulator [Actinomycetia bacterium]|nr:DeoR/GlpR family DNA-binding transcription regulator [Actinomycetes bacterium]